MTESAQARWTGQDVQRLVRYHPDVIDKDPWARWLGNHGGVAAVYEFLQRCPLLPDERAILNHLLESPGEPTATYVRAAAVSRASYFRKRAHLLTVLALQLNSWPSDQAPSGEQVHSPRSPAGDALPREMTSFHGRTDEIGEVIALLRRPDVRILTLTGPGGIGKTRLALRVAAMIGDEFADGVIYIPLDCLDDPRAVAEEITRRLGIAGKQAVAGRHGLAEQLRGCRMLLLLDSFEHVLGAGSLLWEILTAAPDMKVLVTSRAVLPLTNHACTYVVPPLLITDPANGQCAGAPAVALFACRARTRAPSFALTEENATTIAEICRQVDGLPLAIELAAGWSALLSPRALLQRLDQPLSLLMRGGLDLPPRQRTLRASMAWSYQLLTPEEQRVCTRLSVFAGSWILDAAEAVCVCQAAPSMGSAVLAAHQGPIAESTGPAELAHVAASYVDPSAEVEQAGASAQLLSHLGSLLDQSMIEQTGEQDGERRFGMRALALAYARERMGETGEEMSLRDRHARYFLDVAERAGLGLRGPGQGLWLERLEQDHDNFRAALRWAGQAPEEPDLAGRIAGALGIFWHMAGHGAEGRTWLETALAACPSGAGTARAHYWAGAFAVRQGDLHDALWHFEESLRACQARGDHATMGWLTLQLGLVAVRQGQSREAERFFGQACALLKDAGDRRGLAYALFNLGMLGQEDHVRQRRMVEESSALFRAAGDQWSLRELASRAQPRLSM